MTANVVHPAELERSLQARVEAACSRRATRRRQHRATSPRRVRRRSIAFVAGTLLTFVAATVYAAVLDLKIADTTGYDAGATGAGAIVEYTGSDNALYEQIAPSDGTGVFEPFLRI